MPLIEDRRYEEFKLLVEYITLFLTFTCILIGFGSTLNISVHEYRERSTRFLMNIRFVKRKVIK